MQISAHAVTMSWCKAQLALRDSKKFDIYSPHYTSFSGCSVEICTAMPTDDFGKFGNELRRFHLIGRRNHMSWY